MAGAKPQRLAPGAPAPSWLAESAGGNAICIFVYVQPNARSTDITGLHGGRLKVRVAAPALDGRANDALLAFLQRQLGLPASRLSLLRGQHNRMKVIEITRPDTKVLETLKTWAAT